MDAATARTVLLIITACASALWLAGFSVVTMISRASRKSASSKEVLDLDDDLASLDRNHSSSFQGSVEVEGSPAELSTKLAAILANWSLPGAITIEERTDTQLRFRSSRGMPGWGLARCDDGLVRFKPATANRTVISYDIHYPSRTWLLWIARLFLLIGFLAIVIGYWALSTYAVPNPRPGVRTQVIQMFQTIHFLWPPFLFAFLNYQLRKTAQTQLQATIQNLPYVDPNRPPANPSWRSYPG